MKELFLLLTGAFAAIPGITVLVSAIGVPDSGDKLLFGGLIEIFGCITLGLLILNKKSLAEKKIKTIHHWILVCLSVFFISLLIYIFLFEFCVKDHADFTRVYFPLFSNDELQKIINKEGGKLEFIEKWGGDGANKKIHKLAFTELIVTKIIFILVYQLIFTALTLAFGLLAIRAQPLQTTEPGLSPD